MTCKCDILYYNIFDNVFKCDVITYRHKVRRFEKSKFLIDFINDISNSRKRDFWSREGGEGGYMMLLIKWGGGLLNGEARNIFKKGLTPWKTS